MNLFILYEFEYTNNKHNKLNKYLRLGFLKEELSNEDK